MINVTAPINLIQPNQPLFSLAWKAISLGAEAYVASETHAGYKINPAHASMIDRESIEGVVAAGGDIENLPLFYEIDLTAEHHEDVTWAEFAASINHTPTQKGDAFYMEATNGQTYYKASDVIASALPWFTVAEFMAL